MQDDIVHLFVYGTLRTSADHPLGKMLSEGADCIGSGTIQARLYIVDDPDEEGPNSYPAALPSQNPNDRVRGEVFRLHDPQTLLPVFDDYEACSPRWEEPHEFLRRKVRVRMDSGDEMTAIAYLYTWDISTAHPIESGDYKERAPDTR
ncbi:MAG: gamma-glutamylcyclotransferase family protein [Pseudomonadota bacterium]